MLTIRIKKALLLGSVGTMIALATNAVLPKAGYANPLQLAQVTSLAPQTISVSGQGRASVPATEAAVIFTYVSTSYPEYSEETGALVTPAKIPQTADLQSTVDALVAGGIAYDVKVSQGSYDYQSLQMTVRLKNPTSDRLDKITAVAVETASAEGKFSPTPAGVVYVTDNCKGIESTARAMAVADAREQAVLLAAASGLKLGGLSAIAGGLNFSYYGLSGINCPTNIDEVLSYGNPVSFANYNSQPPEVSVDFNVYAVYTIE